MVAPNGLLDVFDDVASGHSYLGKCQILGGLPGVQPRASRLGLLLALP